MSNGENFSSIISDQVNRQFHEMVTREQSGETRASEWQSDLWHSLEESALSLALVPESQGGVGLDARDAFEIIRLSGYHGLPLPLGDTLLAKAIWCGAGGHLEALGENPVLLAPSPDGRPLALRFSGGEASVSGATGSIALGDLSAPILLHAQTEQQAHFLVLLETEGLHRKPCAGPAMEARSALRLDGNLVPAGRCLPWSIGDSLAHLGYGALLRSVQMVGAMQRCVELGLQYAAERLQFGRPIGRFTPVQDMLVEASAEMAAALASTVLAIERWQLHPTADSLFCIAGAKVRCGEAAGKVSALIHQIHGAIGFTQEHVLHQFTRRLWAWRDDFGTETFWSQWLGAQACSAKGIHLWQRIASL